jgi:hypothetical protein
MLGGYLKKWPNFREVSEVIPKINTNELTTLIPIKAKNTTLNKSL